MYTDKFIEHFQNPRNVGVMDTPDAYSRVGSPVCGDFMEVYLMVEDGRIQNISFRTFGCGAAIASSSIATEMVKGMTLDEAMALTDDDVVAALGGLPDPKLHCSNLAASAIHKAVEKYIAEHAVADAPAES